MRVNLRTLGGKQLVVGELTSSPIELQQALMRGDMTFDLVDGAGHTVVPAPALASSADPPLGDNTSLRSRQRKQAE